VAEEIDWKVQFSELQRHHDLDFDLKSGHTAYRHASLIDLYVHTKFHWNRTNFLWMDTRTDGRTDVPIDGRTFPPVMLLGWLRGVDLKISHKQFLSVFNYINAHKLHIFATITDKISHILHNLWQNTRIQSSSSNLRILWQQQKFTVLMTTTHSNCEQHHHCYYTYIHTYSLLIYIYTYSLMRKLTKCNYSQCCRPTTKILAKML